MSKQLLVGLIFSVLFFCMPFAVAQDNNNPQQIVLRGTVTRSVPQASGGKNSVPATDAIVSFVSVTGDDPVLVYYQSISSTVSDAEGSYQLILENLDPNKTYAVRARAPGDVWTTHMLGLGSQREQWAKTADLTLGNTPSERELMNQAMMDAQSNLAKARRDLSDLSRKADLLGRQMDVATQQTSPPAPVAQIQVLQSEISSSRAEVEKAEVQVNIADIRVRSLHDLQQREQQSLNQGGAFGTKRVLFATDRGINQKPNTIEIANLQNNDGKLSYGVCEVAVERQSDYPGSMLHVIIDRDSDRYYSIQNISLTKDTDWWSVAGTELKAAQNGDALLFIHGFNTSFAEACRRAAQIAYDIKFSGPVFLYSWPSWDHFLLYPRDEESAAWTTAHFAVFLKALLDREDLGHLHIVAHSMGNRVLTDGLLSPTINEKERTRLGQIVFAAADVNRKTFHEQYDLEKIKAMRVTLYASNHDEALRASKIFSGFVRLGEVNPDIEIKPGMDSIDASNVDTSLLGHSYIGESRSVLDDVGALISADTGPDQRQEDLPKGKIPNKWWVMNP